MSQKSPESKYQGLFSGRGSAPLTPGQALDRIGSLVDLAYDLRREDGLLKALELSNELQRQELSSGEFATLHYFKANAWANLHLLRRAGSEQIWDWHLPEVEQEVIALRTAARAEGIDSFPPLRLCQIFTNLGNTFSHIGRFVEAISYWRKALAIEARFPMALGNLGYGLYHYAAVLYDSGHASIFLRLASVYLERALAGRLDDGARESFDRVMAAVRKANVGRRPAMSVLRRRFSLGRTAEERRYREWCLNRSLFLNPLNDAGEFRVAARDVMTAPSIVVSIKERGPYLHGFFNQLKQEYVSARYLYYDCLHAGGPHFSDRGVLLYNTLDYPAYGFGVEKMRAAYRMAYSLFDKIAYFLNAYLRLGIPEKAVNFRSIWFDMGKKPPIFRDAFRRRKNWPFRGLYWLSKDLYSDQEEFRDALEPDAQRLKEIRDYLEHKYLKVHSELWAERSEVPTGLQDSLSYSVRRDDLSLHTVRLLRVSRAALIYLSLGMHVEENQQKRARSQKRVMEIPLDVWKDDWKV